MRLVSIFYFLFSTFYLFSQEQFNVVYTNENIANPKTVFILQDTGYATVGGASINNWGIEITIADITGNLISSRYYKKEGWDLYHGRENNCCKIGSNYILSGNAAHPTGDVYNPIDSAYIFLYVMNENFDSLYTYTFKHDTVYSEILGMTGTTNKGFLLVGKTKRRSNGALVYENSNDAFMLKIDSLGQEEWYKTFGSNSSGHDQDAFYKVIQTPDKGYLCAGYTKSWQTQNFFDKGDWWLVKTDSLGHQQWSRRYGHPDYNDGRPFSLMMSSDTSYYIVGAEVKGEVLQNDVRQSHILKLDKDFNEVYQKSYGEIRPTNSFFSIIENNENDLILTGYSQPGDGINSFSERGHLFKLNADGDSIWKRQYTCTDTLWFGIVNRPYSVKQTSDNGYIFTGIAYDDNLTPAQQVWLVKTDEYGCDGSDWWECATNVAINTYAGNQAFYMYPNPANDYLIIKNDELRVMNVEIFDLTGKLVKHFPLEKGAKGGDNIQVDISNLNQGVYFVKVGQTMQKLIIDN